MVLLCFFGVIPSTLRSHRWSIARERDLSCFMDCSLSFINTFEFLVKLVAPFYATARALIAYVV